MTGAIRCFGAIVVAGLFAGCDYSGTWVFGQPIPGLPPVYNIDGPDGGPLVPATVTSIEEIQEATIYGEVSASQTSELGGITAEFLGTGEDICIWIDPEIAFWNLAIGNQNLDGAKWSYPDNVWDDGDLDLRVGLSVYYTGSPNRVGDFVVTYEDELGNPVEIALQDCPNAPAPSVFNDFVDAGRGAPEFCTISNTEPGISYTIALTSWATPVDDDRLAYGLLLVNGTCDQLINTAGRGTAPGQDVNEANNECVITGEALRPLPLDPDAEDEYQPMFGLSAVEDADAIFGGVRDFEETFCTGELMRDYCRPEARQVREDGRACLWDGFEDDEPFPLDKVKCFCGDPASIPENGPN